MGGVCGLGQGSATTRVARRPQPLPLRGAVCPATHLPGGEPARRPPAAAAAAGQPHPPVTLCCRGSPEPFPTRQQESCEGT